jgi:glutamine synthetase type III
MGVFSEEEVNARQEVMFENYTKQLLIEVCIFFYSWKLEESYI